MRFVPALYETPKRPGATLGQTPVRSSVSAEIADLSLGPLHDQLFGGAAPRFTHHAAAATNGKITKSGLMAQFHELSVEYYRQLRESFARTLLARDDVKDALFPTISDFAMVRNKEEVQKFTASLERKYDILMKAKAEEREPPTFERYEQILSKLGKRKEKLPRYLRKTCIALRAFVSEFRHFDTFVHDFFNRPDAKYLIGQSEEFCRLYGIPEVRLTKLADFYQNFRFNTMKQQTTTGRPTKKGKSTKGISKWESELTASSSDDDRDIDRVELKSLYIYKYIYIYIIVILFIVHAGNICINLSAQLM